MKAVSKVSAIARRVRVLWRSVTSVPADSPRDSAFLDRMRRRSHKGQSGEERFWHSYLAGGEGAADLERRLDTRLPLQDYVVRWLDPAAESASILDVGAGPLTTLGKIWQNHRLEITAVDLLGDEYDTLLEELEIVPPVRTITCPTEQLEPLFGRNAFDLVHAENALDHHADVVGAIDQMLSVVKAGGHIVLLHARNEGERRGYHGLHQWNLAIEGDDYVAWNPEVRTSIRDELDGRAALVHLGAEGWRELVVLEKAALSAFVGRGVRAN